jgi:hypothetical protein
MAPGSMGGVGPEIALAGGLMPGAVPPNHLTSGPGSMPGSGGIMPVAGPGSMPPPPPGVFAPQGAVNAQGVIPTNAPNAFPVQRSQVKFVGPAGSKIGWYVQSSAAGSDGKPTLMPHQLSVPGRYNFLQASIYRVKLSDIPGRPGVELYPTIEVVPANPKTDAFLAHNYVPVDFTEEDFDQIAAGNYITKVIYLPDAKSQSQAATGIEELVSTRLEPGVDPIAEAHRRGHILCVVRLGGIQLETANSPAMDAPGPFGTPKAEVPGGTIDPRMAAMQGQMMQPTLPGVSPGMPTGLPGRPPMTAPPAPRFNAPTDAPAGPMVPAPQGGVSDVQQMGYQVGSDGKMRPTRLPRTESAMFPQTTIPPAGKRSEFQMDPDKDPVPPTVQRRKGILDGMFK